MSPASAAPLPKLPAFLQATNSDITEKFQDLEWKQLHRLAQAAGPRTTESPSKWLRPSTRNVLERNRYLDIDPWESNRIKLQVPDGHSDYINASPISLDCTKTKTARRFIATQGPKCCSLDHFWQMIWHETEDSATIVMLTQTHEAGREKCFAYFPDGEPGTVLEVGETLESDSDDVSSEGNERQVKGDGVKEPAFRATVELQSTEFQESLRTTVRTMLLHVGSKTKPVHHYLFAGWPDFSVPEAEDRLALVELVKATSVKVTSPTNPRVVHCSAGVGRSGTFIALDHLLNELAEGSMDIDRGRDCISECVDQLRVQRMMMVQGDTQFSLLYSILKEQWLQRHGQVDAAVAVNSEAGVSSTDLGASNGEE